MTDPLAGREDSPVPGGSGMALSEAMQYMLLGDRRHGSAPADECGAVDPRDAGEARWCRRPNDGRCTRDGSHCSYRDPEEWRPA